MKIKKNLYKHELSLKYIWGQLWFSFRFFFSKFLCIHLYIWFLYHTYMIFLKLHFVLLQSILPRKYFETNQMEMIYYSTLYNLLSSTSHFVSPLSILLSFSPIFWSSIQTIIFLWHNSIKAILKGATCFVSMM